MKIAIISDTHDNSPAVVWIIEYLNKNEIKTALHAGDLINPTLLLRIKDHYLGHFHFVMGNNDGEKIILAQIASSNENITCHNREMDLEIEGKKFYMNHYSYIAESIAQSGDYHISIGGHDHQQRTKKYDNTLFINPGNTVTKDKWLLNPKAESQSTFVLLDLETLEPEVITLPKDL